MLSLVWKRQERSNVSVDNHKSCFDPSKVKPLMFWERWNIFLIIFSPRGDQKEKNVVTFSPSVAVVLVNVWLQFLRDHWTWSRRDNESACYTISALNYSLVCSRVEWRQKNILSPIHLNLTNIHNTHLYTRNLPHVQLVPSHRTDSQWKAPGEGGTLYISSKRNHINMIWFYDIHEE